MTSAPRVERVDDLVVDSQGLDPPTEKWLQAAREAADTDGIRAARTRTPSAPEDVHFMLHAHVHVSHGPKHVQSESLWSATPPHGGGR